MSYMTTGDRIGYERGKEQAQTLVLRQLQKRVGELPQQISREQIHGLSRTIGSTGRGFVRFWCVGVARRRLCSSGYKLIKQLVLSPEN